MTDPDVRPDYLVDCDPDLVDDYASKSKNDKDPRDATDSDGATSD